MTGPLLPCSIYFPADSWSSRFGPEHFTACIALVETQAGRGVYHIHIKFGTEERFIEKRYSDFVKLNAQLERKKLCKSARLPPKTCSPHGSISAEFLETRRSALELWLCATLKEAEATKEVVSWLSE